MLVRLLMPLFISLSMPALAQQTTPTAFIQQKTVIDSLIKIAETSRTLGHAAFNGKARAGRYRVECFYSQSEKEIVKANYLFITDSLNFNKVYYFRGNTLIKINDNNMNFYYQVGDQLFNEQGSIVSPAISRNLLGVIADTWQGLYNGLFQ